MAMASKKMKRKPLNGSQELLNRVMPRFKTISDAYIQMVMALQKIKKKPSGFVVWVKVTQK